MLARELYDLLHRRRLIAALLLIAVTAAIGAGARTLGFDNSYRIWFKADDPALVAYDELLERFGSDEALIVGIDTLGDPYSPATLELVKEISSALAEEQDVLEVWSLTHMDAILGQVGGIEIRPLIEEIPADEGTIATARELVEHSPLYRQLVSADQSVASVIVTLEQTTSSFDEKAKLVRRLRTSLAQIADGRRLWLAGIPVLDEAMYRYSERDVMLYMPVMILVLALALFSLFRSVAAVILPLLVVCLATIWSIGFMGWLGWDANILTTILPPLLTAVGVADSVHYLQQLRLHRRRGASLPEAIREAFTHILRPCLITSVTTAAGMASLAAADLQAIRELGVAAAVGVMGAFALTVVGLPVALSLIPSRFLGSLGRADGPASPRWVERATALGLRRPRTAVTLGAIMLALSLAGIARLEVQTNITAYFFDDDPVFLESQAMDRALGGSFMLEVLVTAQGDADLLTPDAQARMGEIARYLATLPSAGQPFSPVDFITEARRVIMGEPPGTTTLPASRDEAAQLLIFLEGDRDLRRYLSLDRKVARIEMPIAATRYHEVAALQSQMVARLAEIGGDAIKAELSGLYQVLVDMESYILSSQLRSFAIAFIAIIGFIGLLFGSARAGLLSCIPNLLPLAITLGIMGWSGISLDISTILIAPLVLGIVVDDTVHMLERVLERRRSADDVPQAFRLAIGDVGHAIVITTIVLTAGFLTPLLGSFKPNSYFAILAASAMVLALVADLIVFPAAASLAPGLVPRPRRPVANVVKRAEPQSPNAQED